jgi:hypothetical protein
MGVVVSVGISKETCSISRRDIFSGKFSTEISLRMCSENQIIPAIPLLTGAALAILVFVN